MKRIQSIMLALVAVFAFSAVVASAASAEATLTAQWLVGGATIAAGVTLPTTGEGELILRNTGAGPAAVLCSGIFIGNLKAAGVDETTEIQNLLKEPIGTLGGLALLGTGAGPDCVALETCAEGSAASPIEVWPVGLPWSTLIFLDATTGSFLDLVYSAKEVGYQLKCLVVGLPVEDECKGPDTEIEIQNQVGGAAIPAGAVAEPLGKCKIGGGLTGENKAEILSTIKIAEVNPPEVTVDSTS